MRIARQRQLAADRQLHGAAAEFRRTRIFRLRAFARQHRIQDGVVRIAGRIGMILGHAAVGAIVAGGGEAQPGRGVRIVVFPARARGIDGALRLNRQVAGHGQVAPVRVGIGRRVTRNNTQASARVYAHVSSEHVGLVRL